MPGDGAGDGALTKKLEEPHVLLKGLVQGVDAAVKVQPLGQLMQLEAPAGEYLFAAHAAHAEDVVPPLVLYWPAGQE